MFNRKVQSFLFVVVMAVLVSACSAGATPQVEKTPVRVQLAWVPTIEYSPFYIADHNGYFADEGLSVQFVNGGFDKDGTPIDQMQRVASGQADFGMASADQLLVARSKGAPIVAIATFYQRSPIAWVSLADKNITKPQDFIGKKIFVDVNSGSTGIAYAAMMSSLGIDRSTITEVPADDFSLKPLTSGRVDVITAFVNNQPVQLQLQGYKVNVILASDYGIDTYANVIFTTQDMIDKHPDEVQHFLNATLKGIQAAVSNPQDAVLATVAQSSDLNQESESNSMTQALPLFKPAGTEVGIMSDSVWSYIADTMVKQNLLPADTDVKGAYTLEFLNKVYASK
jgi:NitT/TauT family transport system substrate-binding protein